MSYSKTANCEYIGLGVDDEEYGAGTIVFENEENVTVRAHEDGKMFVLPKSALIANMQLGIPRCKHCERILSQNDKHEWRLEVKP